MCRGHVPGQKRTGWSPSTGLSSQIADTENVQVPPDVERSGRRAAEGGVTSRHKSRALCGVTYNGLGVGPTPQHDLKDIIGLVRAVFRQQQRRVVAGEDGECHQLVRAHQASRRCHLKKGVVSCHHLNGAWVTWITTHNLERDVYRTHHRERERKRKEKTTIVSRDP